MLKLVAAGALTAFVLSGPLQQTGMLPHTAVGDLSKQSIGFLLDQAVSEAHAGRCSPGGSGGSNGWGGWGGGKGGGKGAGWSDLVKWFKKKHRD